MKVDERTTKGGGKALKQTAVRARERVLSACLKVEKMADLEQMYNVTISPAALDDVAKGVAKFNLQTSDVQFRISFTKHLKGEWKDARSTMVDAIRAEICSKCRLQHAHDSTYWVEFAVEIESPQRLVVARALLSRLPMMLSGNYIKRSRNISQSPFHVEGGKKRIGSTSVQEIIGAATEKHFYEPHAKHGEMIFASAGREDVDVRCLGRGRRFMITISEPTRNTDRPQPEFFSGLQDEIRVASDDQLRIVNLRIATGEDKKYIQEGAELRRKLYACVIESASPVDSLGAIHDVRHLVIHQKTPVRVAHRRAMMTRERIVHHTQACYISPTIFVLFVDAGAGFYIKEFVHGDIGRTSPSVSDLLGVQCRLVTLDFMGCVEDDDEAINSISANDFA